MNPLITLSLLHEHPAVNSATRTFHARPVLSHTLSRIAPTGWPVTILFWQDQEPAVNAAAAGGVGGYKPTLLNLGPRQPLPHLEALSLARRWSDAWRSPLMQSAAFDRGFHAPALLRALELTPPNSPSASIILLDPASALIDPELLLSLHRQSLAHPDLDLYFLTTPPGLSAALLTPTHLRELARTHAHPGRFLHYHPDRPGGDPLSSHSVAPAPTPVIRSPLRFTLDDASQIALATRAIPDPTAIPSAEPLLAAFTTALATSVAPLPRDVRLDLTSRRNTRPVFLPAPTPSPESSLVDLLPLLDSLQDPAHSDPGFTSSSRLTLAGLGDPLLHPDLLPLLSAAAERGIPTSLETDFVNIPPELPAQLANSPLDLLLVHLPAASRHVYAATMGIDAHEQVLQNLQRFLIARGNRLTPILIPVFTKLAPSAPGGGNFAEMESWYDHYLRHLGHALIDGPSTFAGSLPDYSLADMSPSSRRPCRRLSSRLTLLPNLSLPPCEQTSIPIDPKSNARTTPLPQLWTHHLHPLRLSHTGPSSSLPKPCTTCSDWHRP